METLICIRTCIALLKFLTWLGTYRYIFALEWGVRCYTVKQWLGQRCVNTVPLGHAVVSKGLATCVRTLRCLCASPLASAPRSDSTRRRYTVFSIDSTSSRNHVSLQERSTALQPHWCSIFDFLLHFDTKLYDALPVMNYRWPEDSFVNSSNKRPMSILSSVFIVMTINIKTRKMLLLHT